MNTENFPGLAQFCSSYFHQDWNLEAPDALGLIHNYLEDEPITQVQQTLEDIENLLTQNLEPNQLKAMIVFEFSCYYDPTVYGISYADWLLWVQISLKQGIASKLALSA